jgi:hypothetical protein
MAVPRIPFGQDQPGKIAATMLKVLAAEMSDPARLSRGQRYHADQAVVDIEVSTGLVVCEVQGARPDPYQVRLQVTGGEGVPMRPELRVSCECPDADISMVRACKHGVAAIFTLANEVLIDPEVLVPNGAPERLHLDLRSPQRVRIAIGNLIWGLRPRTIQRLIRHRSGTVSRRTASASCWSGRPAPGRSKFRGLNPGLSQPTATLNLKKSSLRPVTPSNLTGDKPRRTGGQKIFDKLHSLFQRLIKRSDAALTESGISDG